MRIYVYLGRNKKKPARKRNVMCVSVCALKSSLIKVASVFLSLCLFCQIIYIEQERERKRITECKYNCMCGWCNCFNMISKSIKEQGQKNFFFSSLPIYIFLLSSPEAWNCNFYLFIF
jgi:hypothetical protein